MLERIKVDQTVFAEKQTIRGLRVTVDFVLKLRDDGNTADDIVREYPDPDKEDGYQAVSTVHG